MQNETLNMVLPPRNFSKFFLSTGIHTSNKYDVLLTPSAHMLKVFEKAGFNPTKLNEILTYTLTNVTIPNGAINTTPVRTYGENFEMPYSKSYDSSNFTHYLDNNGEIHRLYNIWMKEIYDPYTRTVGYNSNYACDIKIMLYRRANHKEIGYIHNPNVQVAHEPFIEVTMEKAYPKSMNPFSMQGLSGNAPTQFDVTMVCRRIFAKYRDNPIRTYADQNRTQPKRNI